MTSEEQTGVEIRAYHPDDRDHFRQLVAALLAEYDLETDPVLESDLEDPSRSYDAVWLATVRGLPVGSVAIRRIRRQAIAELKRLYLHPAHRGQGIGRALLHEALEWARTHGCTSVVLDTAPAMTSAQHLYRAVGFVETGKRTEIGAHDSRCQITYRLDLCE